MLIDILGHPINVGDTVLTSSYQSPTFNQITKVVGLGPVNIYIEVQAHRYDYCDKTKRWELSTYMKRLGRKPNRFVVVDKQLEHNLEHYPEHVI